MTPILFALGASDEQTTLFAESLGAERGAYEHRHFPDGESLVRIDTPVDGRSVVLLCPLNQPDEKLLPLAFLAGACRALGASAVGLAAPYLAYMRQDRRFHPGEAVTSTHFARMLSERFDWMVTVDPHLHRIRDLNDLYTIPSRAVHAAPAVSEWIRTRVETPLLVGPDEESEQWVSEVARDAGAPWLVLEKVRRGDRDVSVSVPEVDRWTDHRPVLVDDIISTARTMIETAGNLTRSGMQPPICIGVHGVFAGDAYESLQASGATQIVTCNTIAHPTNAVDVMPALADAAREFL